VEAVDVEGSAVRTRQRRSASSYLTIFLDGDGSKVEVLENLLLLAKESDDESWANIIAYGVRGNWFDENRELWFLAGGICSLYRLTGQRRFLAAFCNTEREAARLKTQGAHNNGTNGDEGGMWPRWVQLFLEYFEWRDTNSTHAAVSNAHNVRAQVIGGVIGGGNGRSVRAAENERPLAGSLADREIACDLGV